MLKMALQLGETIQRFAFPLLVGLAISLTMLSRADHPLMAAARTQAVDILAPVLAATSRPMAALGEAVRRVERIAAVHEENARLREQNARLLHWQAAARRLEAENRDFRALLSTVAEPRDAFVTARIVAVSGGSFVRTALIDAGRADGVAAGQAVVAAHGMVGRVVEAGARAARVLLLADLNSRVPVMLEASRAPAIVAGDNSDTLSLMFVADGGAVSPGERLVTSGQGGMLPPGLPVGAVTAFEDGAWRVAPFADIVHAEHVRVLDYALPGLLPATREAGATGPLW